MKFQKLTIHNIASIEDAVIDFERPPLADSEVFLITGKTGAGKSTILDAICLALFNNTPRMKGTQMEGTMRDGSKEVQIDDARQLMRRNASEGSVSLTFTGSNGTHYEAVWSVARARKKVTGNLQKKCWELTNLDTHYTLSKDKEIKQEITTAIGLDFEQFCRTTMLAQGEFTRFLNSKDNEKAAILEKITGVDIYSKIGAKIFEVTQDKQQVWQEAQRRADAVKTFTEEELQAFAEELQGLEQQYNTQKAIAEKEKAKRLWIEEHDKREQKVAAATTAYDQAKAVVESEDFKQKEMLTTLWQASIEARGWLNEKDKSRRTMAEQDKIIGRLAEEFVHLTGGLKFAELEKERTAASLRTVETFFTQEKPRASVYAHAPALVSHLDTITKAHHAMSTDSDLVDCKKEELEQRLRPAACQAKRGEQEAKRLFGEQEAAVKTQEAVLEQLRLPEMRRNRDAIVAVINRIQAVREHDDALVRARNAHEEKARELQAAQADLLEKNKRCRQLKPEMEKARVAMEDSRASRDRQRDTVDKFAQSIRQRLRPGDTCPVCGQRVMGALPHEEELELLMVEANRTCQKAEENYEQAKKSQDWLEAQIAADTQSYERERKKWLDDTSVKEAEQRVRQDCAALGLPYEGDEFIARLDAWEVRKQSERADLERCIAEGEAKAEQLTMLRKAMDDQRKVVEMQAKVVEKQKEKIVQCEREIEKAQERIRTNHEAARTAEDQIAACVGDRMWDICWREAPDEFKARLVAAAQTYHDKELEEQKLRLSLQKADALCKSVDEVLDRIRLAAPQWGELPVGKVQSVADLLMAVNTLSTQLTAALATQRSAKTTRDQREAQLSAFLADHLEFTVGRLTVLNAYSAADIEQTRHVLEQGRSSKTAQQELLREALREREEHLRNRPLMETTDTPALLNTRAEAAERLMEAAMERRVSINQLLTQDKINRQELCDIKAEAQKKRQDYQKWSRLNQLIGDKNGKTFQKIAQSYVLSSLVHSANHYIRTLTSRYTLRVEPGTFVIILEDAYQGYVARAASTISGGESFLVSLALALALSDIGQQLSVDTLFIDEGFGTLSGEPLQKAIDTLRSLHTRSGRHVGIISHVEELKERIPVQIQVNQEGNHSASTVSVIRN